MANPLLSVRNLSVAFGKELNIVVTDNVQFDIFPGEIFSLVGESGCGKSVTAMSILQLLPEPGARIISGNIFFENRDLTTLTKRELLKIRGKRISCIFQEAMSALNPVMKIKKQLEEVSKDKDEILKFLIHAGLTDTNRILNAYPHELSGGMLQRICIVMALLSKPSLLIADEPTTALDVTVQAEILDLLKTLSEETNTAVLLITHNMGIVSKYADRVAVMYAGRIVECGPVQEVIKNPLHPYTEGLLNALPKKGKLLENLIPIPGNVPAPKDFVPGCRFRDRCRKAKKECVNLPLKVGTESHYAFCFK